VRRVYLDHNSTTPLRAEARERWLEVADELGGNPSSLHARGRRARQHVDEAREQVAAALSCREEEVIFTSGGTESNNAALWGVLAAGAGGLVTTGIEHSSILEPARALERRGVPLELLPVDARGVPRVEELEGLVRGAAPALVSIAAANNEIGSIAPLARIAGALEEAASPRPLLHTDAAQALGRIPVDLCGWGVDLASFSAHKIGGPLGTGVLWKRHGLSLEPLLRGGSQEAELRAGTEDVAGIAAAALAFELAVREQEGYALRVSTLCRDLWKKLAGASCALRLVGPPIGSAQRLPNTLCVLVEESDGKVLVTQLDLEGLEVGAGSACASGSLRPSHVLLCLGLDEERARSAIRLSIGRESTWEDCAQAVDILEKVLRRSSTT
jgi:cysteine desulfurase